ncbi:MAG: transcription termination/antitermination protein NusA [Candidatus Muproteobacteria bacterium RIFCSPHIGHO2_01_FULL_65_16]|uniref:Transcription termination/antitermination protein NusA n=2 Tax=Candidatus Muproteobacteria TaxID=1817795 RepID=A0A1F6TF09_9PROT|nr:MAG: transcription termination/antitermination protein NusA [Candidatus Muproteobacteria bacterium RBG_16_65_31]OGI44508.1 MAG: transcription termination/antitermination protein NusA [Candidatus Muproteobacteria bacterium RIFCSPHIGHO2_01_FULL_65_16]
MGSEILMVVDAVSREKGVAKEVIFQALEAALATATRKRHKGDIDARVAINRDTGAYDTFRRWEAIPDETEVVEFPDRQIKLSEARARKADIQVGEFIEEPLEPVEFGRIAAQAAKQVIMQKVREAEREQVVKLYEERKGEMVTGVVKRMERGDVIVDLGNAEALLSKTAMIPREGLRPGDRIRALLEDVKSIPRGPQLFLSRTSPKLLAELFKLEVPEAGEGLIVIHGAARDPGLRAKIAVSSTDPRIDPIGACVGMRGSRVQSVSNELAGERVDIIQWSDNPAQFVINALAPAEVRSIVVDEELHSMDVMVDEKQLSQSIGRGGQNVRLAGELTGWELNIMTEEAATEKGAQEASKATMLFMESLAVDENVATVLVQEGFSSLEEIAYVPKQELLAVEEFDEGLVEELRNRARDALLTRAIAQEEKINLAEPAKDLLEMAGMDETTARMLASHGIKSMEELAEQAVDDLLGFEGMTEERARELIMTARAPWFENREGA